MSSQPIILTFASAIRCPSSYIRFSLISSIISGCIQPPLQKILCPFTQKTLPYSPFISLTVLVIFLIPKVVFLVSDTFPSISNVSFRLCRYCFPYPFGHHKNGFLNQSLFSLRNTMKESRFRFRGM